MSTPFRIGFVGTGGIAGAHMRHLEPIDGVELHAISDVNEEALAKVGEDKDIEHRFSDYRAMLELDELDAVSVCTPNFLHAAPTIAALEAGKHVIVEKPMAMTVQEAQDMCAAAKANGKHLVIGFQWRFTPKAQFLRRQVAAGAFGDIHYVRVQALRRRGIPSWGVFYDKAKQGGGAMIDIGVHMLEMAHFIVGKPTPTEVFASEWTSIGNREPTAMSNWGDWNWRDYTIEDGAVGMVKFADGMNLVIETAFASHIKHNVMNVQIMGSKGGGTYEPLEVFWDQNGYMLDSTPHFVGKQDGFAEKMKHFVAVCRGERECDAPGEDGLAIQQILNGIYDAASQGGLVTL